MIIFDEPAEIYHANPAIGSSALRDFIRSPRLFKDRQEGLARKETPALTYGIAHHMLFLEPLEFAKAIAVKPKGMSFATKDGKLWAAEQSLAGKTTVTYDEMQSLNYMRARMPVEVRALFLGVKSEVTIRNQLLGIPVQCRFDIFGDHYNCDLKSIDAIENIDRSILKYGYHIQQRWYQRIERSYLGKHKPFYFVFSEKSAPFRWRIVELDMDYIALADNEINNALHHLGARIKSGCWDDPEPIKQICSPPHWLADRISDIDTDSESEV